MKYFSGFSGIGGFDLGLDRIIPNAVNVGYSEVNKYAIKIYEQHFPNRTNYGDIKKIEAESLPDFDVFCGGFPCQDVSIAGKRKGLCGARSGLFFDIIRIIRAKQPRLVFLENVKGLLSSNEGWDFARILVELEESGYDVEWQVLNSKNFGVPQNRERVFIIGHLGGESWKPVFPIQEANGIYFETTANCLDANYHKGYLNHGSLSMIQITPQNTKDAYRTYSSDGLARTLKGEGGGLGAKTGLYLIGHTRDGEGDTTYHEIEIAGTLKQPSGNQQNYVQATQLFNLGMNGRRQKPEGEPSFTLDSLGSQGVTIGTSIRRLTPLECERLQGYPDGWTDCGVSDTQRYKCLGNAVTVNVIEAVCNRIIEC